ncbi:MAG: hypothetical protein HN793_12945, partial [Rhodospirillaceae bacterium]|nr:hypothetical protein [Rhodospirillaceae bacterium]
MYAVSAGPVGVCHVLDGVPTGSITAGTVQTSSSAGAGPPVLYALVSQGPNGRGAFRENGIATTAPVGNEELENCAVGSTCAVPTANTIYTGPQEDDGNGVDHFDDELLLSSTSDFQTECETFAENEKSEFEFVEEGFSGTSGDGDSTDINVVQGGGASASTEGGGVLTVTEDVVLSTVATFFTPNITPLYNRIEWTPTAAPTNTGFSIVTRADTSTRVGTSGDYTLGITCQFFGDGIPANAQTIAIRADAANLANSGGDTYTLTIGQTYELECFDDGSNVWARITEVGNTSNQATVFTTDATDLATPNQVIFVHSSTTGATSTLDNLLVHKGSIALELDNGGTVSNSPTPLGNFASETSFTGEGWLYLRDTAAGTVDLFSVDDNITNSQSLIRADVVNSEFEYSFNDDMMTTGSIVASSQTYGTTFWRHSAFNCDTGVDRSLYAFGSAV